MRAVAVGVVFLTGCSILFDPPQEGAGRSDAGDGMTDRDGSPGWLDGGWAHRKRITLHAERVAGELTRFPVLIRLDRAEDLGGAVQPGGEDLVVTAADGSTRLAHEVEASGESDEIILWVKIPSLSPDEDTTLFLFYGNPEAPPQEDPPAVWENGFRRVYHLGEPSPPLEDSTGTENAQIAEGTHAAAPGYIGGGLDLERDNSTLYRAGGMDLSGAWSVSAWIRNKSFPGGLNDFHILDQDYVTNVDGDGVVGYWDGQAEQKWTDVPQVSAGSWDYYVWDCDGGQLVARVNGVSSTQPVQGCSHGDSSAIEIGGTQAERADELQDELRFAAASRSAAWTATEYANMSAPGEFYTLGPEESVDR